MSYPFPTFIFEIFEDWDYFTFMALESWNNSIVQRERYLNVGASLTEGEPEPLW